jgi:hypothetical protein
MQGTARLSGHVWSSAILLAGLFGCGPTDAAPPVCETFDTGFEQELAAMAAPLSPRGAELPSTLLTTSSYDRASLTPGSEEWFANYDRNRYLGLDALGHGILVEHTGPGALLRLWSANPNGTLRIYLDDGREPAIEVPFEEFLSEQNPLGAAFAYGVTVSAPGEYGANLYVPIPFERYLRVTYEAPVGADQSDHLFWQASIKAYEPGVCVESFDLGGASSPALAATGSALTEPSAPAPASSETLPWDSAEVAHTWAAGDDGAELELLCVASSAAIDSARTVLELRFDGVTTVRAPLRDFFAGLAGGTSETTFYTSYDASTAEWCTRFRMPFREGAELRVIAPGAEPERELRLRYTLTATPFDSARYFHAQWQRTPAVVENQSDQRAVTIEGGEGFFVGLVMAATNHSKCWWGEGDEKVHVDDEPFPRLFGTGTEDYFGYAWASSEVFLQPFHGQPEADVGQGTDVCGRGEDLGGTWWNYRFHHLDPIDFQESLRFDMEVWHWGGTPDGVAPLEQAYTGFWYGSVAQAAPAVGDLGTRPGVWPAP